MRLGFEIFIINLNKNIFILFLWGSVEIRKNKDGGQNFQVTKMINKFKGADRNKHDSPSLYVPLSLSVVECFF